MIKTLRWIYELGYDKAMDKVFRVLESEAQFHQSQAQLKATQKQKDKNYDTLYFDRKYHAQDHEQRGAEVAIIQNRLDPKQYPNIDDWLELMR